MKKNYTLKTLAVIFSVGVFVFGLFLYWNYYFSDDLASHLPSDVISYIHIKEALPLQRKLTIDNNKLDPMYNLFDEIFEWNISFRRDIIPHIQGEFIFAVRSNPFDPYIFIIKGKNNFTEKVSAKDFFIISLDNKIFALTKDTTIQKNISLQSPFHAPQQYSFMRLYFADNFFPVFLKSHPKVANELLNQRFVQAFSPYFHFIEMKDFFVFIKPQRNFWRFQIPFDSLDRKTAVSLGGVLMPQDIQVEEFPFAVSLNGKTIFSTTKFDLKDPRIDIVADLLKNIKRHIGFLWSSKGFLVIFEMGMDDEVYIRNTIGKIALSFYPEIQERRLPDDEIVEEYIVSPDQNVALEWQEEGIYKMKINESFFFMKSEEKKVYITDNVLLLQKGNTSKVNSKNFLTDCSSKYPGSFLYLKPEALPTFLKQVVAWKELYVEERLTGIFGCFY